MHGVRQGSAVVCAALSAILLTASAPVVVPAPGAASPSEPGIAGGALVVPLRAEPRTFNPVTALDAPSREVIRRLHADLVRINRGTLTTEPELAERVEIANGGRTLTITLRNGLRFSDGHPCTADDVVFSFERYLDVETASPQRDLLVVGGEPLRVRKIDARRVAFEFAAPYGPGERLFDSVAILPKHVLEPMLRHGSTADLWSLATPPDRIVGLGPFRLREYVPGQRIVVERNPFYWKRDGRNGPLPYLDRMTFVVVSNEDAQVLRLQAGELDIVGRLSPANAAALEDVAEGKALRVIDAGPSLEYNFLAFNLNPVSETAPDEVKIRRGWFARDGFRRAVSLGVDRGSIVRLIYLGRAAPIWVPVSPANRPWYDEALPRPPRSVEQAREALTGAGFSWSRAGALVDGGGHEVRFSILVASGNVQRQQMAAIVQHDLEQLGMRVSVVPLEFRSLVERVTRTFDYDASILGLASGDVDPAADLNVWLSTGATHLWRLDRRGEALPWETEIDALMERQLASIDYETRKRAFDRVQAIAAERLPVVPLATPHLLVGARRALGNVRPSVLDHSALWNSDEIFWRGGVPDGRR